MPKKAARTPKPKRDRTRNDKGILLEQIVAMLHKEEGVKVETNVFLLPKSGDQSREREIDVLLTRDVAGYTVRVAIQCKNYGKPITIGQIGEFKDLLDDVGIPYQYGIIISVNRFQSGALKRAKELGIKTLILEGLDKTRLRAEIQDAFQFFVHLLLVVEGIHIRTEISDSYLALCFCDEGKKLCGFITDLIVSHWRNGEIPTKLGEYTLDLKLPNGWRQDSNGKFVYPSLMSASVRVVGYLAEMSGKAQEFKLKEADTNKIEKFHLQANFDVLNNLIKASHEEPIFSEEELRKLKKDAKASLENRFRLPKIFFRNHLEPVSERAFNFFMEGAENLTIEEISLLPPPNFEEVEGDAFTSMQARAVMGEPVIIDDGSGILRDVRLLFKQRKFDEVIELYPLLAKFPRKDFAEYLTEAFLKQGELLLEKSLTEEGGVRKALETQGSNFFDRAIEISPNVIDTHIYLGVIFGIHGLYERSIRCFEWVMSAQPQNAMARHNLARTYVAMGRPVEALDAVNKAIEELQGVQPKLHFLRAKLFGKEGKYQEATADLETVWKNDYKEIVENERCHEFVRDVFNNYPVLGTAIILSDIYSYYIRKLAKANSVDESTSYLNTTVTLLEDIHKTIKYGSHDDFFEDSFYQVLNRVERLVDDISPVYPTDLFKARLEALKPTK